MRRTAAAILGALMCRGVGHTRTMQTGTNANDCIVIAHNAKYAREIAGKNGIALSECEYKLRGIRKPIAIDNCALQTLIIGLLKEIDLAYSRGHEDARRDLGRSATG